MDGSPDFEFPCQNEVSQLLLGYSQLVSSFQLWSHHLHFDRPLHHSYIDMFEIVVLLIDNWIDVFIEVHIYIFDESTKWLDIFLYAFLILL
jgi:hypothetical protein